MTPFNVIGSPEQLTEHQRAPTITAIKREALRVFPAQARVTAVSVGRLPLREGWLCTVLLPGGAELTTSALTKQGALSDAYDLLRGLQAVTP